MNTYAGIRLKESLFLAIAKQLRLMEAEIGTLIYQLDNLSRSLGLFEGAPAGDRRPGRRRRRGVALAGRGRDGSATSS